VRTGHEIISGLRTRRARATGFHRAGTESNLSRADMLWATKIALASRATKMAHERMQLG
jgi:hypothetical protein